MNNSVVPANMYEAQNAYRRLQSCLSTDDLKVALMEIKTFLKIYPDLALACNDLGVLYYRTGEKLLALACYEKANRLQPGTAIIIKNLAEFYFVELGWTDDAIMLLTRLLQHCPEDGEVLTALGMISERIGRVDEACSFYRRALDVDPDNGEVRKTLARLEGAQPVAECRKPVHIEPIKPVEAPEATNKESKLGDILARLRASIATPLSDASETRPAAQNAEALYAEAQQHATAGADDRAINSLEKLINIYPDHAMAWNDLGVLYTRQGDLHKAVVHHETAVAKNPASLTFRKNLAALYYSYLGRTDEAIGIYTKLLTEQPGDVETLTALAIISEANNLKEQARTFIGKVLELEPWNEAARNFLAGL